MPSKNRPAPKPVAWSVNDGGGFIVTKTHDAEAARDAILEYFQVECAMPDDEALEELEPYLDLEPEAVTGRWILNGNDEDYGRVWRRADPSGRGVTKALQWILY